MTISLKDRVAIVTGGGGGLGREYALTLAKAGAKVVVNDYGGDLQGNSGDISRAQSVVNEIKVSALGTATMTSAAYATMQNQRHGRIINISSSAVFGLEAGGDCAYSAAKGAVFAMTREMGRFAPRHGIKVNGVLPGGATRMAEETEAVKVLTTKYFPTAKVAPFVLLLASDECPTSGELFAVGAGRAANVTLVTYPGSNQPTAEKWLEDWPKVMGRAEDIYIPKNTADDAVYIIKHATGDNLGQMADFGMEINGSSSAK